jgi:hypothetical protein
MVSDYLTGKRKISLIKNWFVGFPPATVVSARHLRRFSPLGPESLTGIPLPGLRNIIKLPFDTNRIDYFGDENKTAVPPWRLWLWRVGSLLYPGAYGRFGLFFQQDNGGAVIRGSDHQYIRRWQGRFESVLLE